MRISLTLRSLVDLRGPDVRLEADLINLGLPQTTRSAPEGFTDFGVVIWQGDEYYLSGYKEPVKESDEDDG